MPANIRYDSESMKPWYGDGLRFTCTQCGDCCRTHDDYAHVYLLPNDITRLAKFHSLERREFLRQFTKPDADSGMRTLNWDDEKCVFLGEKGCVVYEARPEQCRTWPFWPENLTKEVWAKEIVPFCPGADEGRLYSIGEIKKISRGEGETSVIAAKPETKRRT